MAHSELHRVTAQERISSAAQGVQPLSLQPLTQGLRARLWLTRSCLLMGWTQPQRFFQPCWFCAMLSTLSWQTCQEPAGHSGMTQKCEQSFAHQVPLCLHQSQAVLSLPQPWVLFTALTPGSTFSKWPTEELEFPSLSNSAAPLDP